MFLVQVSLLIVTFLSLVLQNLSFMQTTQEKSTHTLTLRHVSTCGVSFSSSSSSSSSYATCWMLVHIAREGQVEWITLGRWRENKFKWIIWCHVLPNSIVSRIHVNTTNLHNIMCTLVATNVILRSLECSANIWLYSRGPHEWTHIA
jgi:hypothetical protein